MDTLFDLNDFTRTEAVKGSEAPATTPLGKEIAARATFAMQAKSDAISRWVKGAQVDAKAPLLAQSFFADVGAVEMRVANVIVAGGVVRALRLTECPETADDRGPRLIMLSEPRVDADGLIVDSTGECVVPERLMPGDDDLVENGGYYIGGYMDLQVLVCRKGVLGVFRPVGAREGAGDVVCRVSEVVEIPASLIPCQSPQVADQTVAALWQMHRERLRSQVTAIHGAPLTVERIKESEKCLRALHPRQRCWLRFSADAFHERERDIVAPLTSMFEWSFLDATGATIAVSIDPSYGWKFDIRVRRTAIDGEELECQTDVVAKDSDDTLRWFDEARRVAAAQEEIARSMALVPNAAHASGELALDGDASKPNRTRRSAKADVALNEDKKQLRDTAQALARLSLAPEVAAVVAQASTAAEANDLDVISAARRELSSVASALRRAAIEQASAFLSIATWDEEVMTRIAETRRVTAVLDQVSFEYSEDIRRLDDFMECVDRPSVVREIAPGYWVSVSFDGSLHGAVSETGFYSVSARGAGEKAWPVEELARHLLDSTSRRADRIRAVLLDSRLPSDSPVARWLLSLPLEPERNALGRALRWIGGLRQAASITSALPDALIVAADGGASPDEVHRIRVALTSDLVDDVVILKMATTASALIDGRHGAVLSETKSSEGDLLDEEDLDAEEEEGPGSEETE